MSLLDKLKMVDESDAEIGEEIEQVFVPDPEPGDEPASRRRKAKATATRTPSTARLSKQVSQDLASMLEMTAAVWGLQDQCCAPVLEQQAEPIADALVGVLSRNPRLLRAFASANIVSYTLQGAALARALAPVGKAIYHNHISKAVTDDDGHEHDGAVNLSRFPAFQASPVTA